MVPNNIIEQHFHSANDFSRKRNKKFDLSESKLGLGEASHEPDA